MSRNRRPNGSTDGLSSTATPHDAPIDVASVERPISDEAIRDLVEIQRQRLPLETRQLELDARQLEIDDKQIDLEAKRIEVELKEMEHNRHLSEQALNVQADDMRDERAHDLQMHKQRQLFILVLVASVVAVVFVAMALGKDQLVHDIVKILGGFAGGFGVGSVAQRQSGRSEKSDKPEKVEG